MKKILSLLLFSFLSMNTLSMVYALELAANTPVLIQTQQAFDSSSIQTGDTVKFTVVNNVNSQMGKTVIAKGTEVTSTVTKAKKSARIGAPGKITISDFYTTSTKGEKVPLTGAISAQGKSKMGLSIALSVIVIPFFLFMKGKDVYVTEGSQYTVYTAN